MPSSTLLVPSPAAGSKKRPHSTLEILSLSPPTDQKRVRHNGFVGIEEIEDVPNGSRRESIDKGLQRDARASPILGSQSVPELDSQSTSSFDEDGSESTSSSGSSSEGSDGLVEAQNDIAASDLLSVEESTSTSSSSSSSSDSRSGSGSTCESESESARPSASPSPVRNFPPAPPEIPASDLSARLQAFLPTIAAANAELEEERRRGELDERDIENVDEDGYIEMNLGLGVLEEKDEDAILSSSGEAMSDDEAEGDDGVGSQQSEDVLRKLMGSSRGKGRKPGIQEVASS